MKCLACIVVLLMATSAMADLTAVAVWNAGPVSDPGWEDGDYPMWVAETGFDWVAYADGPADGVVGWPRRSATEPYPNSDGVGKWGGALWDETGTDGNMYTTIVSGQPYGDPQTTPPTFADAQGTVEFWFKPEWDPILDSNSHSLISIVRSAPNEDGLLIRYNGDGTVTTQMREYAGLVDIGHDWVSNPLIEDDWNHVAVTWDANGTYSYCNGEKVGEHLYAGPAPAKMSWDTEWMGVFFGAKSGTIEYQSDGLWDSFGVWDDVHYSATNIGDPYTMPTEEIPVPGALRGDLNDDGWVGQADLDIVLAMWGNSGAGITDPRADENEDDFVGQTDLDFVLADWGQGVPLTAPVPEPATMCLLAIGGAMLLKRRR